MGMTSSNKPFEAAVDAETARLRDDSQRKKNWKRWGPYMSERQWGTVREDYSPDGSCWTSFPHDMARSRAYRWGEDGLMGITDRECRLCFMVALWNEKDPILKERLFGLINSEGNHGEDVKENYYYLDSTPTHSYMKILYKYTQNEFPYGDLVSTNKQRSKAEAEYELEDTGAFDDNRYFDVITEYAKADADDVLIRISVTNRGPKAAPIHLLPTLWFRNTWSWGSRLEGGTIKGYITCPDEQTLWADHVTLKPYKMIVGPGPDGKQPDFLVTENESNNARVFGGKNETPYVKDSFHDYVIHGKKEAVNPDQIGTKAGMHYKFKVPAGKTVTVKLRLVRAEEAPAGDALGKGFDALFAERIAEADAYYATKIAKTLTAEERNVARQGYAGLLWSKQYYHYDVKTWLAGDPNFPKPPAQRLEGRNADWTHLYNRDVISMPDKWEYPWYAAWDLAFHTIPLARVDPDFAKEQLVLMLREWYMHPNGQIPAYEFAFGDVNPPVHAWACWRVYKMTGPKGKRDRVFLSRVFQKLLINFTWWVNRKDVHGKHIFAGGFLGLDNIGVFDRSRPLPGGGYLEQADGTAWMGFYCTTMLAMALELAKENPATEDIASKFFEHFIAIVDAMNSLGGNGLWDEGDGFYYDQLHVDGKTVPLRLRSMVGLIPLFAVEALEDEVIDKLPGFKKRLQWFLDNRKDLARHIAILRHREGELPAHHLLAIPSKERLVRVLKYMLDESEFLSPYGFRSMSKAHQDDPYLLKLQGEEYRVDYTPGESVTDLFGGNSNWRGPIWMPVNFLLVEALERYHFFYGDTLQVECPTGSGIMMNLKQVAQEITRRLTSLFVPRPGTTRRPCFGGERRYADDPAWKDLVLFHEYFHGDTGRGLGATHQTGWTSLIVKSLENLARPGQIPVADR
jgi:hypothetical protein